MQPTSSPSYPSYPVPIAENDSAKNMTRDEVQPPYGTATPTYQPTPALPSPFSQTPYSYEPPPMIPPATPNGSPNGQPWRTAFLALVMLVILGLGIGVGVLATRGASTTAKSGSALTTAGSSSIALPSTVQDLQQTIITTTKNVEASVVEVQSRNNNSAAVGSGEFLTADGYIVTNDHVVAGFSTFSVTLSNGKNYTATLIGGDPIDDLAVLKANVTNATPITFGDSSQAQVGEFVIAIGAPLGLQQSASFGVISGLNRTQSESNTGPVLTGLIQTSAPINHGNSGGALVDLQGHLLGIPTLGATDQSTGQLADGIGFAINSNQVKTIATELMQNGKVTNSGQGFLGIQGADVTASDGLGVSQGVQIQSFANDTAGTSPAQAAGLQAGDIIIAVNGQNVSNSDDLANIILPLAPGTKINVTVVRGTSQQTVTITLGQRPQN